MDITNAVDVIYRNFENRKKGLSRALLDQQDQLYEQCDPKKEENLCLFGELDGSWSVRQPEECVPPQIPEPCLGINYARDGLRREDWLQIVAMHSDCWLYSVAFFEATKLDCWARAHLFQRINSEPTLHEILKIMLVAERCDKSQKNTNCNGSVSRRQSSTTTDNQYKELEDSDLTDQLEE
eukprot:TRINITY_DN16201_c0_g1_i1.p1 TRINITY_DN16201_c0_g1~~TRINITY_DN16201_c0_g1_i1.p1  ORF type:complete len:181 (+),score=20.60 TRINITY_DN16201_c0_g1_i1:67-609(+)